MMLREGWKELLGSIAVLAVVVTLYGGLLHLIWILLGVV
jgi:ferrous iron transport protein B